MVAIITDVYYKMARRTPVADGLEIQLALLDKYNYKVVSVSDLIKEGTSRRIKLLQEAPKGRVCKYVINIHPYSGAVQCAIEGNEFQQNQNQFLPEEILTVKEFNSIGARYFEHFVPITLNKGDSQQVTHAMAIDSLAASL